MTGNFWETAPVDEINARKAAAFRTAVETADAPDLAGYKTPSSDAYDPLAYAPKEEYGRLQQDEFKQMAAASPDRTGALYSQMAQRQSDWNAWIQARDENTISPYLAGAARVEAAQSDLDAAHQWAQLRDQPPESPYADLASRYEAQGNQAPDTAASMKRTVTDYQTAATDLPDAADYEARGDQAPGTTQAIRTIAPLQDRPVTPLGAAGRDGGENPRDLGASTARDVPQNGPATPIARGIGRGLGEQVGRVFESGRNLVTHPESVLSLVEDLGNSVGPAGGRDNVPRTFAPPEGQDRALQSLGTAGDLVNVAPVPVFQLDNIVFSGLREGLIAAGLPEDSLIADAGALLLQGGIPGIVGAVSRRFGPEAAQKVEQSIAKRTAGASAARGGEDASRFVPRGTGAPLAAEGDTGLQSFGRYVASPEGRSEALRIAAGGTLPTRGEGLASGASALAGGAAGVATAPEDATTEDLVKRGITGAALSAPLGLKAARGVRALREAGEGLAREGERAGVIYGPTGARLSERGAESGIDLLPEGAVTRERLIEDNIRRGMPLRAATDAVDGYIAKLSETGKLPADLAVARTPETLSETALPAAVKQMAQRTVAAVTHDAPEKATFVEKAMAVALSNLFTPGTVGVNVAGNIVQTASRPLQTLLEGRPTVAWADLKAMAGATGRASGRARQTFLQGRGAFGGDVAQDMMAAVDRPEAFPGKAGILATPIARTNQAIDEFFRSVNTAGASAVATARGMTPKEAAPYIANAAATSVFQGDPSLLTRFIAKLGHASEGSPVANTLWRASVYSFFPFVRIQEQLTKQAVGTFVAPVTQLGRLLDAGFRRDPDAAREAFAKWTMATALWGIALDQANRGNLTGVGTGTPQEGALARNARDAQGNPVTQQEAARVGGRWFPTDIGGPWGMAASDIASFVEGWNAPGKKGQTPPDAASRAAKAFNTLGRNLNRQFYLDDFIRFANAVGEGRGVEATGDVLRNQATRLVPGLLTTATQLGDPVVRDPQNPAEAIASRIPGLSGMVAPKIDPTTGDPVTRGKQDVLSVLFRSPAPGVPNPVASEVTRLEAAGHPIAVPQLPRNAEYAGAKQTPAQRLAIARTMGRETKLYVTEMLNRPEYQALPDDQRAATLNRVLGTVREVADRELGEGVARDPRHQAMKAWSEVPHYAGVTGSPNDIATQNYEIAQARALRAEYQRRYGPEADGRLYKDNPAALGLARRPEANSRYLDQKRKEIDSAYGGALTKASRDGLPGAGNTLLLEGGR